MGSSDSRADPERAGCSLSEVSCQYVWRQFLSEVTPGRDGVIPQHMYLHCNEIDPFPNSGNRRLIIGDRYLDTYPLPHSSAPCLQLDEEQVPKGFSVTPQLPTLIVRGSTCWIPIELR